jgi:hypothetical protein
MLIRRRIPSDVRRTLECLEDRTTPSVNLVEAEPNNAMATANAVDRLQDTQVIVSGTVSAPGDRDWFRLQLRQGDVFGAALKGQNGLNPALRLVDAAGTLLVANDDTDGFGNLYLPQESPLPVNHRSATDSEMYYVISTAGTYFLEVSASGDASAGKYDLDTMVARPGMESRPVGARQILFLDFDGATVDFNRFSGNQIHGSTGNELRGQKSLLPLAAVLPDWGLTTADLNAVIDGIVSQVTDKSFTYVRANGLNPTIGLEIWNSRDHADPGNDPLVSRIVVGGTGGQSGFDPNIGGMGQDIDVGNFKTDDMAVALLDFITHGLQQVSIQTPATARDFAVAGTSVIIAHEVGHLLGCWHTEQDEADPTAGTPNLMDPSAPWHCVGPDRVFGTADDGDVQFGVDQYKPKEPYRGRNDTLNTVAFALSVGQGRADGTALGSERQKIEGAGLERASGAFAGAVGIGFRATAGPWAVVPHSEFHPAVAQPNPPAGADTLGWIRTDVSESNYQPLVSKPGARTAFGGSFFSIPFGLDPVVELFDDCEGR